MSVSLTSRYGFGAHRRSAGLLALRLSLAEFRAPGARCVLPIPDTMFVTTLVKLTALFHDICST